MPPRPRVATPKAPPGKAGTPKPIETVPVPEGLPAALGLQTSWTAPLWDQVRSRGVDAVWQAGLDELGYPPTWAETAKEQRAVEIRLESPF